MTVMLYVCILFIGLVASKDEKPREASPEEQKRMLYWKRGPVSELEDYAAGSDGDAEELANEYRLERLMQELRAWRNARGGARYVRPRRMLYWRR
ncbi:unnamed protein product [Dibothriocephalus latus]|uniref:Uncharacterized protein n=1 Tax=Dibothriocephalus latus TaxID=60516 RepID=A0A3P7MAI8_DIBLA|nr:unnamed protein product [Dibothriocephalus latus]